MLLQIVGCICVAQCRSLTHPIQTDICDSLFTADTALLLVQVGNDQFYEVLDKVSGQKGKDDWAKLQKLMRPLAKAATAVPPIAIRADPGVALTAVARYLPRLLSGGPDALKLIGPFSKVNDTRTLDEFAVYFVI